MSTVTSQLQQLRIRGRGWEPMWLAVLRRIDHRGDLGYERWCKTYLKRLRGEFAPNLCHLLYTEPLTDEERAWAAHVEYATFQDYIAAGNQDRAAVAGLIPHMLQDDQVPSQSSGLLNGAEGRDGECPDQSAPPHVSQSRNAPPDESDEMGLFQREPGRKDTWENGGAVLCVV